MVTRIVAALAAAALLVPATVTPAAASQQPVFSYQTQAGATHKITSPDAGKCYRLKAHGDLVLRVRNATDLDAVVSATANCKVSGNAHVVAHGHVKAKIALAASVRFRQA
ncbi:MAG: hypothetical protein GEV07_17840 [Streptosporangiales bacterium]|nr:hypothetical protein [Streptosporangiales bacterium]